VDVDWDEIADIVRDACLTIAPKTLAARVRGAGEQGA
jgi:hypothetical protein